MSVYAHTFEDYCNEVRDDARRALDEECDYYDDFETFCKNLWVNDSVTGNGSGSYYFNAAKAKQAVSSIIWDEEFSDMCEEWGYDTVRILEKGPEVVDVILRCYALGFVEGELEDYWREKKGEE